jgi:RNA polymerase sigma-70 factor (ECF subfamily)
MVPAPHSPAPDPEQLLQHVPWVRALAGSLVADPNRADDLAQETWVRALRRPPAAGSHPRGWLASILRNLLRQEHRAGARRSRREAAVARPEAAPPETDVVERASTHRALVELVTELEEPFRTTVLLRYFDELAPAEIARRLEVPEATVRSRLRRGLERLRTRLDALSGGDRSTWVSALAPLAWPAAPAPGALPATDPAATAASTTPAGAGVTLGVLLMNVNWKLAAACAVVVGGLVLLPRVLDESRPPEETTRGGRSETRPDAARDPGTQGAPVPTTVGGREAVLAAAPAPRVATEPEVVPLATVRGRVIDVDARPVRRLELLFRPAQGAEIRLESEADGSFAVTTAVLGTLTSASEHWATVLAAELKPGSELEPVLVVAPSVTLAGLVEDENGAPLRGARVKLEIPQGYLLEMHVVLDASRERDFLAETDEDGRFRLEDAPSVAGATVVTRLDGFRASERNVPSVDTEDLRITLRPLDAGQRALRGEVVDAAGAPVAGASVAAGLTILRTGPDGRFLFDPETSRSADEVLAILVGYAPARLRATTSPDGPVWPEYAVLRLQGETRSIAGRVVDEDGEPLEGMRVWLAAPTLLGLDEERMPIQVESVLAGFPSKGELERDGGAAADSGHTFWGWVATDAEGRFRLEGLLDRSYVLRAMDNDTLAMVESEPLESHGPDGGDVVLELPTHTGHRRIEGRVLTENGVPVAGARLVLMRRGFHVQVPDAHSVSWDSSAAAVESDAEGRFVLPDVPPGELFLNVSKNGIKSRHLPVEELESEGLVIRVEDQAARCHIQVSLVGDASRADSFALLDGEGEPAQLALRRAGQQIATTSMPLTDGRSPVLGVLEGTYELVLYADGEEIEREWVTVVPGEVVTLPH